MKTLYFHGRRNKKNIALTFDDGPCKRDIEILKILKKEKIPATFFVLGKKIKGNEKILKQMIKQGCEIGNHTYHHSDLMFKTPQKMKKQIIDTDNQLKKLNIKTDLIRCPHGRCGLIGFLVCKLLKKKMIFFTIDSKDWTRFGKKAIVNRVLRKVKNGSIIVFHSYIEEVGENKDIISAIKELIPKLKQRGYKLSTVSQLIK